MKTLRVKKVAPAPSVNTSVHNVLVNPDDPRIGMVKIYHLQGVKQSKSYQSGDVSYAVELFVPNTPADIKAGITQAEDIVENALGDKLPQMGELLDALAVKNR